MSAPYHLLTDVGTIKRFTTDAKDSSGVQTVTFVDHIIDLPFRFQPISATESVRYGRESTRRMWQCFTETGNDITEKDQIEFIDETSGSAITKTLDIQEIRNPQLSNQVLFILAEETE